MSSKCGYREMLWGCALIERFGLLHGNGSCWKGRQGREHRASFSSHRRHQHHCHPITVKQEIALKVCWVLLEELSGLAYGILEVGITCWHL